MDPLILVRGVKSLIPMVVPLLSTLGVTIDQALLMSLVEWLGTGYGLLTAFEAAYKQWKKSSPVAVPAAETINEK